MRTRHLTWALALAVCASRGNATTTTQYQVADLGLGPFSVACDLNNLNQSVIGIFNSYSLFRDTDGAVTTITNLPNATSNRQVAVNNSGTTVGRDACLDGTTVASIWSRQSGKRSLGTLPGYQDSEAFDINDSDVVVGRCYNSATDEVGFMWTELSGMVQLSRPAGDTATAAYSINSLGQIVGKAGANGMTQPCVWNANGSVAVSSSTPHVLGATEARVINDNGCIAGNLYSGAYLWQPGSTVVMLPGCTAAGLNNANGIAGSLTVASSRFAFFWSASTGVVGLPSQAGGTNSSQALAVNDSGVIAGYCRDCSVLWTPVPEPTSLLVLLIGLAGTRGMTIRRKR